MQTMSNWLGFDADAMRSNPEMQAIIADLTIEQLQRFYEDKWLKWENSDPIYTAVYPGGLEND